MIKDGPFFTLDAAQEAAQADADQQKKTQYVVVFKASYYLTDEKPDYEGGTVFYRLAEIVEPRS